MSSPLRILTVCSYNRARSVMAELLLRRELAAVGVQAHVVGAGFAAGGQPPLAATVTALHAIGIDARSVLSTRVDEQMVADADLVLTAERLHVVRLVEGNRDLLAKVFTLPEFAALAPAAGPRGGRSMVEWLAVVGAGRTHATFQASNPEEVIDPAGQPPATFALTAALIQGWSRTVAELL
jgi:protein-tyrosine phosphatase